MRVGIVSVGSELVTGHVTDTNSSWCARRVVESGCSVAAVLVIGDDRVQLLEGLEWLAQRSDVLVIGGGLGPTADDLTRYAVAEFAGQELERRAELTDHLNGVYERLARAMPPDALRQADVPVTAEIHAPQGTAAGFALDVIRGGNSLRLHVLPGVPWEYREVADRAVMPDIVRRSGGRARITRTLHVAGLGESGVGEALRPITDRLDAARARPEHQEHGVEVGFLATDDEVLVRVTATGPDPKSTRERAQPVVDEAVALLGEAVTSLDERKLEDELAQLFGTLGVSVATAEAFTGGRVAASLTSGAGSCDYVRGGYVAYPAPMLTELLGMVDQAQPQTREAGRRLAEAVAVAVRRRTRADFAVATVGVVDEREATQELPVGTALWAIARPDGTVHAEDRFIPAADRGLIQIRGAAFALESLRRQLVAYRFGRPGSPTVKP